MTPSPGLGGVEYDKGNILATGSRRVDRNDDCRNHVADPWPVDVGKLD